MNIQTAPRTEAKVYANNYRYKAEINEVQLAIDKRTGDEVLLITGMARSLRDSIESMIHRDYPELQFRSLGRGGEGYEAVVLGRG